MNLEHLFGREKGREISIIHILNWQALIQLNSLWRYELKPWKNQAL